MESKYHYFKRDISWLSFNYRVLLEADDDSLPLYERINFISIYSSNLEEFYKIRVAEHKAIASGGQSDDMTQEEARHLIHQITEAVNSQMEDRIRIYEHKIVPALRIKKGCVSVLTQPLVFEGVGKHPFWGEDFLNYLSHLRIILACHSHSG